MVFATNIDPYNDAERAGSRSARHFHANSQGDRHISDKIASESHSAGDVASHSASDTADGRKVVPLHAPLHVTGPATRVKLENKALLLPRKPKLPLRLQLLNRVQQGSAVMAGVLVAGALAIYGSTVYVDKSTSRALIQLDELQGESQQLTSANESIKQSLAEQAAREDSGLEPYEADDVIRLTPAPKREGAAPPEPAPALPGPLGY